MKKKILFLFTLFSVVHSIYSQDVENDTIGKNPKAYHFDNLKDGPLFLDNPTNVETTYDPKIKRYIVREKIGNSTFSTPKYYTEEEFKTYILKKDINSYFKNKRTAIDGNQKVTKEEQRNLLPSVYVNNQIFETIFGGNEIQLNPRGSITVNLGMQYQNLDNPLLSEENRKSYTPSFDQQIRANINAKVGKRLNAAINFDSESTFNFQNQVKIDYTPTEDDIIRKIEVGNVTMDIKNNLIQGSQSLFGVKTQLQFGKTNIVGVFSQQQSQAKNITAQGGAALSQFELRTTQYDANRHFFLSQYFRNQYNESLKELPLINSAVQINKVEIWVTNRNSSTQDVRNIVALVDLGESGNGIYGENNISSTLVTGNPAVNGVFLPRNEANNLEGFVGTDKTQLRKIANIPTTLTGYNDGNDYSILENARKLNPNEFTFHPQLGYVTLNSKMVDGDVLAVGFEYSYKGQVYRVGELSTDGVANEDALVVKLLRPQILDTTLPSWRLMMKNVYSLGAYELQQQGFKFDILYRDDKTGQATNNLLQSTDDAIKTRTILNILNLDRLDPNNNLTKEIDPAKNIHKGDGYFDFVNNLTVDTKNGAIFFPNIEPFGRDLATVLTDLTDQEKYVFSELYTNIPSKAENQYQNKDKYLLKGLYKSNAADGIALGAFNVPRGSVKVSAGGILLKEGLDYTVDYIGGRVKIINPAIESGGQAINVSLENNSFFNQQRKTFVGLDVEHKFNKDFILGATYLKVTERPLTNKVQFGQDPINNSMYGVNVNYSTNVPFLTNIINYLPNIETNAPSKFTFRGDLAYLQPNSPSSINIGGEATTYLDDFEGAQIPINLDTPQSWHFASTPLIVTGDNVFSDPFNANHLTLSEIGKKRAKLAWYAIDQLFYNSSSLKPANITPDELSRAEVRPVNSEELYPQKQLDITQRRNIQTFNLSYFPTERGPYNYSDIVNPTKPEEISSPTNNWGGIMRGITTPDFYRSNIQYLEFWLQDPYEHYSITNTEGVAATTNPTNQTGNLYIDLGNISEDILKDNRKSFENGLPADGNTTIGVESTDLANIPTQKSLIYAFDNGDDSRKNQDIGLDGMSDATEKTRFNNLASLNDPSSDNYEFFRSTQHDNNNASILKRYKSYNNPEGNSPTANTSTESYPTSATNVPDAEDVDKDQTMNTVNAYWQYKIDLSQNNLSKGNNAHIVDERTTTVTLENGKTENFKWYLFRVPITEPSTKIGNPNLQSVRHMRMFLTDFAIPVSLRMADLQLVRGDWRAFDQIITENVVTPKISTATTNLLETGIVNIEENENRIPVNYVLPPTITRESLQSTANVLQQNEQSLVIKALELEPNNTIGIYKNITSDLRMYDNLKMFIHAEELVDNSVNNNELVAVVRLGSDTNDNFYQIEIPLALTNIPNFGSSNAINADEVWPTSNNLDVSLTELSKLKLEREANAFPNNLLYPAIGAIDQSKVNYRVKGNPNLSNVRTVFLGVKNTSASNKSAELWFNELRLTGFKNQGGWATKLSAQTNIADFANVAVNGDYQSIGFGSIDQNTNMRSQESIKNFSANTSANIGQLLPKNWNISIPFSYTMANEIRTPKFDPKYEDVLTTDAKQINPNSNSVDITSKQQSISFINVKKNKSQFKNTKNHIYDIENVSVSYSYNDRKNESYTVEKDVSQQVNTSANYTYNFKQLAVKPLHNIKVLDKPALQIIKDFNFNILPGSIGVNSKVTRGFSQFKSRDILNESSNSIPLPTLSQRNFLFDWDYNINYPLTSAINLTLNAANHYIYDDFERSNISDEELDKITLYSNFFNIGRPGNYNHTVSGNYKLPIHKIPLFSFIEADYTYSGNFNWQASSPSFVANVGNSIQNSASHNFNSNFNFLKLYDKLKLKELIINNKERSNKPAAKNNQPNVNTGKNFVYKLLTAVESGRFSYIQNNSTLLDGYVPEIGFLGRNNYDGSLAPTLGFVLGDQRNVLQNAITQNWLVTRAGLPTDVIYNKNFNQTTFKSLNVNVSMVPIKSLNIDLNATRSYTENSNQIIDLIVGKNTLEPNSINQFGNYNITYSLINTAFKNNSDAVFAQFVQNRTEFANQFFPNLDAIVNAATTAEEKSLLYNQALNSQEVLMNSLLAAYSEQNAQGFDNHIFRKIPLPNWTVNYRGLTNIQWLKKTFSSIIISHGYTSSYTISNFSNNLNPDRTTNPFQSNLVYNGITLVDNFSPLVKLDIKLKNSLSFRGTLNKNRALNLNLSNVTLSEINGQEFIFGLGYRFKDVTVNSRFNNKKVSFTGDINVKADVSYRTDISYVRDIQSETSQTVGGQNLLGIKLAADYNLSRNFTATLFYDQNISSYAISTLYPRQNINAGISMIYNLGN